MSQFRDVRVRTAPIQVRIAGGFGRLMNISATGALVHARQALAEREYPVVIYLKPDPVELRVRVVRSTAVSIPLPGATVMKSDELGYLDDSTSCCICSGESHQVSPAWVSVL
jgi:hypothetical protein